MRGTLYNYLNSITLPFPLKIIISLGLNPPSPTTTATKFPPLPEHLAKVGEGMKEEKREKALREGEKADILTTG